jgi:thioredoxin 1
MPGFVKLCKAGPSSPVVFVKHNVYDDDAEEVTDVGRKYNVHSVPMFKFFRGGDEVESFATRDKARVADAINRHAGAGTIEL